MPKSLFFYDLETSSIYPDSGRIMQFAGQRTDMELNPTEAPVNFLISLSADVLPEPDAILVNGISPQQTLLEGLSEAEFLKEFHRLIAIADTTFVGFNNIRFDDEFIRYLNYRNLYDPYAWSYENNCSRWDILDVVRLTRALRPEGINWPTAANGANVNRLELLTKANNLEHETAHDALSDVMATIALARLIKQKQPKLYAYLYELRLKNKAMQLVDSPRPFIYTSSHYPSAQLHTTAVVKIVNHPDNNNVLVFDLRYDPSDWVKKTAQQLANSWRYVADRQQDNPSLPVKTLRLNRCPAIAPLGVLNHPGAQALALDLKTIEKNLKLLREHQTRFAGELIKAIEILDLERDARLKAYNKTVDARLYDGFFPDEDRRLMKEIHSNESTEKIRTLSAKFKDNRLTQLSDLYLSRNYNKNLTQEERIVWEQHIHQCLFDGGDSSRLAVYFKRINQLAKERTDSRSQFLLEDLKLYGESLIPGDLSS